MEVTKTFFTWRLGLFNNNGLAALKKQHIFIFIIFTGSPGLEVTSFKQFCPSVENFLPGAWRKRGTSVKMMTCALAIEPLQAVMKSWPHMPFMSHRGTFASVTPSSTNKSY